MLDDFMNNDWELSQSFGCLSTSIAIPSSADHSPFGCNEDMRIFPWSLEGDRDRLSSSYEESSLDDSLNTGQDSVSSLDPLSTLMGDFNDLGQLIDPAERLGTRSLVDRVGGIHPPSSLPVSINVSTLHPTPQKLGSSLPNSCVFENKQPEPPARTTRPRAHTLRVATASHRKSIMDWASPPSDYPSPASSSPLFNPSTPKVSSPLIHDVTPSQLFQGTSISPVSEITEPSPSLVAVPMNWIESMASPIDLFETIKEPCPEPPLSPLLDRVITNPQRPSRPGRPRSSSSPKTVFACDICPSTFVRRHDLKRHSMIHTGVRPFQCECGRYFSRQDALIRHTAVRRCDRLPGFEGSAVDLRMDMPSKKGRARSRTNVF